MVLKGGTCSLSTKSEIVTSITALPAPVKETDEYGFKDLFEKLNQWARCPNDNSFLVWKDEKKDTLLCEKCGFEKPAEPAPT